MWGFLWVFRGYIIFGFFNRVRIGVGLEGGDLFFFCFCGNDILWC